MRSCSSNGQCRDTLSSTFARPSQACQALSRSHGGWSFEEARVVMRPSIVQIGPKVVTNKTQSLSEERRGRRCETIALPAKRSPFLEEPGRRAQRARVRRDFLPDSPPSPEKQWPCLRILRFPGHACSRPLVTRARTLCAPSGLDIGQISPRTNFLSPHQSTAYLISNGSGPPSTKPNLTPNAGLIYPCP